MQEAEQKVIPDYSVLRNNLFEFLDKNNVVSSLEYSHLPPMVFTEEDRLWLSSNGYDTLILPGNSIQYWLDYKRKNWNTQFFSSVQLNCSLPQELRTQRYWPTEVALHREELFIPNSGSLNHQDQLKRVSEWKNTKQIPPTIDVKPATIQQYVDLIMSDFQKNVLRIAFGTYYDFMRARTETGGDDAHLTIALLQGSYRVPIIREEKDSAEREKLGIAPLLFPAYIKCSPPENRKDLFAA